MSHPDPVPVRRALLSVSDKTGVVEFARALVAHGAEILSTGGTAQALRAAAIAVRDVAEVTGFPEILGGRVKTLLPQIHGGLLGRRDDATHRAEMAAHGIAPIDLLAVTLYPFEATVAAGATPADCVEQIDIGGPAMIRSAAKNHAHVAVMTEPAQLAEVAAEIAAQGGTTLLTRARLAAAAFARTAAYDAAIAAWFARQADEALPDRLTVTGQVALRLRYGENPHQTAALYGDGSARPGVARGTQHGGKPLSWNNIADADAAFECVAEFDRPAIVIVKHANPCGVAVADTLAEAWALALRGDPVSAFGGVVAANRPLDGAAATRIAAIFTEVVIAPDADADARAVFAGRRNLRLVLTGGLPDPGGAGVILRSVAGGLLAGTRDAGRIGASDLRVVTRRAPTAAETVDLLFAWRVCKHVKSNAIVLARDGATVGIGAGQMSRVDSARLAGWKAEAATAAAGLPAPLAQGAAAASDAFFPFADGLEAVAGTGAAAIIQPGGSVRDAEVIAAADAAGIAMVFTGMRHFRH